MIRFYPRDIGLWRKTFVWNGISEPSKTFDDIESLKQFCGEHGVNLKDENFPFYLEPCSHYVMGKQFTVMQWTCIGWISEEREVPAVSAVDRSMFTGIGSSESFTVEGAKKAFGVEEKINERERLEELTKVTLDAKAGSERFLKKQIAKDQ